MENNNSLNYAVSSISINFNMFVNMNKFVFLLFFKLSLSAQSISKQVIATLGNTITNGSNQLSLTVGEIAVGSMTADNGSLQLGNGYYPSLNLVTLNIEAPKTNLLVRVYPNPTKEKIFISHPNINSFKIFITDVTGKLLLQKQVGKKDPINIERYPKGTYIFNIISEEKKTNSYKIIKQ
jgi:hypothetical protein|tara:strand:- start:73 stop:612 length:540 start_codon:yes stop_codon:yes gene_type:complete